MRGNSLCSSFTITSSVSFVVLHESTSVFNIRYAKYFISSIINLQIFLLKLFNLQFHKKYSPAYGIYDIFQLKLELVFICFAFSLN